MTTTPPPASIVRLSDAMYVDARELQTVEASLQTMDQQASEARALLARINDRYPAAQARRQDLIKSIEIAQEVLEDECTAHHWDTPPPPPEPTDTPASTGQPLPIEQEARATYAADPTVTGRTPAYTPEGQLAPQMNGVAAHV